MIVPELGELLLILGLDGERTRSVGDLSALLGRFAFFRVIDRDL